MFEVSGRRFNRAVPAASLMLAKPTMRVPHEGGLRFEEGSDPFETIVEWISQGAPFGDPQVDAVTKLDVQPTEIFLEEPGESQALRVCGSLPRRIHSRDVSKLAVLESNSTSTAKIEEGGSVMGERIGEAGHHGALRRVSS